MESRLGRFYRRLHEGEDIQEFVGPDESDDSIRERLKRGGMAASDEELERAVNVKHKLDRDEELASEDEFIAEAIVLPAERPVVDVVDGTFGPVEAPFQHFPADAGMRARIEATIPAIGRIGLPNRPDLPSGGTGFVVGPGVLMTNRHAASLFAQGVGVSEIAFMNDQGADINFTHELGRNPGPTLTVDKVLMIHPFWDMALLSVSGLDVPPLTFLLEDVRDLADRDVGVIGYPAFDSRNDASLQLRIFRNAFNVKRLQPGKLRQVREVSSFSNRVHAVTHDCSTLGGNSGSCVIDVKTGQVVALHFAGRYLDANFAVPMFEFAKDGRVHDGGVAFGSARPSTPTAWNGRWRAADPVKEHAGDQSAANQVAQGARRLGGSQTWTIPLTVEINLGAPAGPGDLAPDADGAVPEAMVEPFHEDTYDNRTGYDPDFLGVTVPLPICTAPDQLSKLDNGDHVIPYQHCSLAMQKARRLALFTACNVSGEAALRKPDASKSYTRRALSGLGPNDQEKWFTDPRIPALHQLPDRFFTKDRASFDKGHLVRRDAVAWGDSFTALRRANGDTYHVTNCSPQVKGFNRSNLHGLWGKLENLVLDTAEADRARYVVLSGPILRDDDPPFAGRDDVSNVIALIPRSYWKIVVVPAAGNTMATFAFKLEQDLTDVDFGIEFAVSPDWQSRMISLADLEAQVDGLTFPEVMHDTDQSASDNAEHIAADARKMR
ncbi:MAG: DNA/RNA non-specific endonuclease [Candidatus Thiodiazotropha endolucinida]